MNNGGLDLPELGRRLVEAVKMKAAQVTRTESHEVLGDAVEHVFDPPRQPARMSCRCSRYRDCSKPEIKRLPRAVVDHDERAVVDIPVNRTW